MQTREEDFNAQMAMQIMESLSLQATADAAKSIVAVRNTAPTLELKASVGICAGYHLYLLLIESALDAGMPPELVNKYVEHTIAEARAITRGRADS